MAPRHWKRSALLASLLLGAACAGKPPPAQPPTTEVKPSSDDGGEEVKPPPPKCEALSESCAAAAETKARIAKASFSITPVVGWTYAQGEGATVAQASETGSAMAVVGYDIPDPKKELAVRESALEAAAKEIGVTLPKKKVNWKKAADTKDVAAIKISLWEAEGALRKEKKGTLLIFASAAPLPDNKGLVGLGFVPDDDKDAEKIGESLQASISSITPTQGAAGDKPAEK